MVCIAGGIILRFRDTKTGALLQVPQQWWKLCRKVAYGMYIKWKYNWFGNKYLFFFNIPSELTLWLTYVFKVYTSVKAKCSLIWSNAFSHKITYDNTILTRWLSFRRSIREFWLLNFECTCLKLRQKPFIKL
jgi:hypothetical protein